jgi:alginate O-acetyltransferase complex protein AlgI
MVFSSYLFCFVFLPLALAGYYGLPRSGRHLFLTVASYVFYGWANPAFTLLMLFSTLVDWVCGLKLAGAAIFSREEPALLDATAGRSRRQKLILLTSIVVNLSLLGFFKYFNFAVDSYNSVLALIGLGSYRLDDVLRVVLPLGISFYTFQSMSYSIDIYRGQARALRNPIDFACFVAMFPQLVAGPIVRFQTIAEQLRERSHTLDKFVAGITFFALGMAKKVLIANPCGKVADLAFAADSLLPLDAWLGAVAYAFQIYFDFSGYSDMAIGLGLMFGFVFLKNFDSPYRARSITEFWRRWHISLSTWLRDYLYLPLGGNRLGVRRTYINLLLVMVLGGLWHGAAWTFVIWGAWHGLWLAFERWRGLDKQSPADGWRGAAAMVSTFVIVLISWVFFRAESLSQAGTYLGFMFGWSETFPAAALVAAQVQAPYHLLMLGLAALIVWRGQQSWDFVEKLTPWRLGLALTLLVVALALLGTQGFNPFIYFIF